MHVKRNCVTANFVSKRHKHFFIPVCVCVCVLKWKGERRHAFWKSIEIHIVLQYYILSTMKWVSNSDTIPVMCVCPVHSSISATLYMLCIHSQNQLQSISISIIVNVSDSRKWSDRNFPSGNNQTCSHKYINSYLCSMKYFANGFYVPCKLLLHFHICVGFSSMQTNSFLAGMNTRIATMCASMQNIHQLRWYANFS